ncbi:LOW QUALITY PROTEIN: neuroblast differentiation-associated protein AHNAK [Amblyraja radiata]|uniref:LOW QUALITY PROTEIN: neuroblast differentiation-associated protein AHNAK n=1 Tax=Amblyraja radiata TaxID=386614 RepID=UPI0014024D97|nr:LOW QUALITY PROTEIN: neuroblast differentiation-associated protein AHNAK [Amblyraja radiata]
MAKKEDDLDVLLPSWAGAAAHGFTISGSDDGIFIKDVVENSPVGKSGVMKEGDQIVSATIYFDEMGYDEAQKILQTVDRHTVGLKLHRKGERLSPGGNYSWDPDRFGATSPDAVLSGDDEDYQRIFRKKIKPRLKSEDGTEASDQDDISSSVRITRKVITRTVHVTNPTVMTDVDIHSPEFKIKVPRHEQVSIEGSGPRLESSEMDMDVNLAGAEGLKFQMGDGQRTTHTMHIVKTKVVEVTGPDTEHGQTTFHMPQINLAGGTVQTSNLDVKFANTDMGRSAPNVDVSLPKTSIGFSDPNVTTGMQVAAIDTTIMKQNVHTEDSDGKSSMHSIKMPACTISEMHIESKFPEGDIKATGTKIKDLEIKHTKVTEDLDAPKITFERDIKVPNVNIKGTKVDIETTAMKQSGLKFEAPSTHFPKQQAPGFDLSLKGPKVKGEHGIQMPSANTEVRIKGPKVDVDMPEAEIEGRSAMFNLPRFKTHKFQTSGLKLEGQDVNIDANLPEVDVNLSGPSLKGEAQMPNVNIEGASKISGAKFGMPGFNVLAPKTGMADYNLDFKGPKVEGDIAVPDVNLKGDIKGPKVDFKGPKVQIEETDIKGSGAQFSMPHMNLPKVQAPEIDLNFRGPKLEGDHRIGVPSGKVEKELKGPQVDVDVGVSGAGGIKFGLPKHKLPKFHMDGSKVEVPVVHMGANVRGADVKLSGSKLGGDIKIPDVDVEGTGKIKGSTLKGVLPSGKVEGGIKAPKVDVDMDVPSGDVEGVSGNMRVPKFKLPKFQMSGSKVECSDLDFDVDIPSGDIKLSGPKLERDVEMPDVDVDVEGAGKITDPKFRMPGFNLSAPTIGMPDVNLDLKGTKIGQIEVPDVKLKRDIKGPNLDIKGPNVNIETPDLKGRGVKFSLPSMHLPKIEAPDINLNSRGSKLKGDYDVDVPSGKVEGEFKGPKVDVDVDVPQVDVEGDGGKFSLPKFKLPKFHMGGSKGGPDVGVDMNLPEADVKLSGPKIEGDVKMPDVDVDVEGAGKFKGPTFKTPGFDVSAPNIRMPDFNVDLGGPKMGVNYDMDVPSGKVEGKIKGPKVDVDMAGGDVEGVGGGFSMPKFKLPKFRMGGSKVEGPDMDIDANIPSGDIKLSGPKLQGDVEMPDVDVDVEGAGKIKGSKFRMPGFNISAPKIGKPNFDLQLKGPKVGADIDVPDANLEGNIKGPSVDIKGPRVDIETPDVNGSRGKLSMPSIHMPKFQAPDIDLNFKSPKLKGDYDVEMPSGKFEGEIKAPKVDVDMDVPGGDVEGIGGKFSLPKFKMPKFHMGGPKVDVPDVGIDANIPEADVKLSGPKIQGGVEMPDVDLDIEGGSKIKGHKLHMPKFNISAPKIGMPDFNLGVKGPKVEGDVGIPDVNLEVTLRVPSVDIKGPRVDIETPDVNGSRGKFSLPSIHMPKFQAPDLDLNFKGPNLKGDYDVDMPSGKVEGEFKGPKVDVAVDVPRVDVEGDGGKFSLPKFKLPKFHMGGSKGGPDMGVDMNLPEADVKLSGPKIEGDVKMPDVDVDVEGAGKFKGPSFKTPGFDVSAPKIRMPDVDLRGPKMGGNYDVDLPSGKVEGKIKGPKVDVDMPGGDVEGVGGGFSMPKFKMPKFRMGGSKVEGPDMDIDANIPSGDIQLSGPKLEGDVEMPDVDVDVEGAGKIKGSKFHMPKFNLSAPKIGMPDFNLGGKGPKVEGDVGIPDVNLEGDIKGPSVDIKGPRFDIETPDVNGSKGKFSLPSIHMPKFQAPDLDLNFKGPNLKGDYDVDMPSGKVEGEFKGPKVDVDMDVPRVDVEGDGGKFSLPKFKLPKFHMGGSKGGPDVGVDMDLPEADVKLSGPKIEGDVKMPDVDVDVVGAGKFKGPTFKTPGLNVSAPNIRMPDFNVDLGGPKIGGNYDVDLPSGKVEGKIKGPKFDVDVPGGDVEGVGGGFSMPKFKMPKFRMGGSKVEGPDMDIDANIPSGDIKLSGPKLEGDVEMPDVDVDVEGAGKIKGSKFHMPKFNISAPKIGMPDFNLGGKGPKVEGDVGIPDVNLEGDIKGPNVDIKGPRVDIETPDVNGSRGKFSLPSIHMPKFQAPDIDLNFKSPKLKGDYDVDMPSGKFEGEIKAPKVDVDMDVPGGDVEGIGGKFSLPKFKMPKFHMGGSKVEVPDVDIDANIPEADIKLSGPKIQGGVEMPDVDLDIEGGSKGKGSKFHMPKFNLSAPKIGMPDFNLGGKGPKVEGDVGIPDVNLEGDIKGPNVDIKGPRVDIETPDVKGSGFKMSMPSIQLPKFHAPDLDLNFKGPNLKGDYDVDMPSGKVEGELKGPKVDVDVDVPRVDVEGDGGKFSLPKFKLPKFHMGGSKGGPDVGVDMDLPEADVKLSGPKIEGDVKMPDVDVDVVGAGKFKGPTFKTPGLNVSAPNIRMPDFNVDLGGPKIGGNYDVDLPSGKVEGKIKGPKFDVDVPGGDVEGVGGGFSMPKFKMPKFRMGGSKVEGPDMDIDANIPSGDIKLSGPKLEGDVEMPDVDVDVEGAGKIKGSKFHMPKFNISAPKIGMPDFNLGGKGPKVEGDVGIPDVNLEGDIKGPNVDIKGPRVDIETPDVNGSRGKFSLPSIHMPKFQAPDIDLNFKSPKLKGDYDVDMPSGKFEGEIKAPKVDVDMDVPGGDVEGIGGKFSLPKFKMPKFHMGGSKVEVPDVDIDANIPEADIKLSGPKIQGGVEMPDVDLDIEGGSKGKGSKFHMPKFNISAPKIGMPDFNLGVKGPKVEGDVGIPDVNLEGDIKGPNVDIKGPRVDIETPDVKGSGFKMSMPSIQLPKFHAPDLDLNFKGPNLKGDYDVDMPSGKVEGELKGPKVDVDVDVPRVDVEGDGGKFSLPKFKLPKFHMGGSKGGPDVGVDMNLPEADVKLSGPKIEGDVKMPDVGVDVEGAGKFKGPSFKMPGFDVSAPKIRMPDVDLRGPKIGGNYDVDLPSGKVEGKIKGPKVDVDMPGGDVEGVGGGFSMPKFKMPKFRMGGSKVEGPDMDIDANIPSGDIKLSGPKLEGNVEMPDVDVDVEGAGKIKGSKFHMPKFNLSAPKIGMPDFNLGGKGPKVEGDVGIPDVNLEGDVKGPNVDIKGPRVDIETPDVNGSKGKFSLPSIHMPKFQAPDIDLNFKSPKLKGDYDVDMPSGKFEGEIKAPKVDVDMDVPGGDVEGIGGKFSLPKFKMPKFHMGGSKVEVPDVDIDANIPEADIKLSGPKIQGGVEMPDVDLDIEGGSKGKGSKFHMPKFNLSAPKIGMPDFNLGGKGPKVEGDVGIPDVNLEGDIKGPNVDIKGPRVDFETPDVNGSRGKISMPSIHMPKFHAPDIDLNFKSPKLKGDYDVEMPSGKFEGEIKAPKIDVDMDVPGGDVEGTGGKFSLPKFKMPKFHMGGSKVEVPDVDIDANIPEADIKLSGPKIQGGVEMPDVDLDIEGGSKGKGSKFHMPKFNLSAPKIGMPDFNLGGKGPKVEGDVGIPDVNLEGDIKGPNVDIKGPRVDFETPDVNGSRGKISMPSIHMPKFHAPDIDLNFKSPKLKGDYDVEMPSGKFEGEIKAPKIDVDMDVPGGDVEGTGGKFSLPKFKMPKFHMGGSKVEVPDVDIDANIPEADIKLSGPKIQGGVEMPDVDLDIEGGSKGKGSKFHMPKFNLSAPKIGMPDFNLGGKGPKVEGDVGIPDVNLEGDIKGPNVDIKGPRVDFETPDVNGSRGKISMPSIHMPKFHAPDIDLNFKSPKLKGDYDVEMPSGKFEGEIKAPKVDVDMDVPGGDVEGDGGKFSLPKFKLPKFHMGGSKGGPDVGVDMNLPEADVKLSGPKIEGDVKMPDVDVDVEGAGKFKGPSFKMPGFDVSAPKIRMPDVDLRGPKMGGNYDVDLPSGKVEGKIKGPKVDVDMPGGDVEGVGGGFSMPKFKMPKFRMGGSKVEGPDMDIDANIPSGDIKLSGPKLEGDVEMPDVDVDVEGAGKIKGSKFHMPKFNISAPKIGMPDFNLGGKGPKVEGDVGIPDVNLEGDIKGPNVDIKGPRVDIETPDVNGSRGKFSLPSIHMPKFQAPDIDLNFKSPKLKGDYDVDMPSGKFEGEIKAPKVDVDMDVPGGDVEGIGGKFSLPKFKMPKFHMGGSKVEVPDVDIDANIPEADIKLSGPKIQGGVEMPDVDLDIEGGSKGKGSKFHMPKFNLSAPKIGMPDFNLGGKGPKVEGDVGIPDVNLEGDIKGPNVDIKGPRVDIETPDVKGSGFKMSMPSIQLPKFHAPDLDLNFKGPNLKGDYDVDMPSGKVEGEFKGPKVDVDMDVPQVDVEGDGGKFSLPKFKLPKFHMGGSKGGPDVGVDMNLPEADVKLSGPKIEGDVKIPDVDVDVEGAGKFKGPTFKMPGFDVSAPNIRMPDFNVDLGGPKMAGNYDVDLPSGKVEGKIKGPKVDVDVPGGDVEGVGGGFSMPKFKMPKFRMGGSKVEGPDMDIDANIPSGDIKLSGPKLEGDVEMPDVDVEGAGKIKGSQFRMPGFNISAPKIGKPDFNLEFKGPKVGADVDVPDVSLEGDFKGPNVDIKAPKLNIEAPDVKGSGGKISLPSIHLPKIQAPELDFSLRGPKVKGDYDVEVPSANIEGGIKAPQIGGDVSGVDADGGRGKFNFPKFKMPKFRIGGSKEGGLDMNLGANVPGADVKVSGPKMEAKSPDVDFSLKAPKVKGDYDINVPSGKVQGEIKGPKLDVNMPGADVEGGTGKFSFPKFKMPRFHVGGPKVKGHDIEIEGPKIDLEGPDIKGGGGKLSMPKIHAPDVDLSFKSPKLKGDYDINMPSGKIEGEMKAPKVDIDMDVPGTEVEGTSGKFGFPKFKMPKFHMGGPKIEAPDLDINAKLPQADVSLSRPKLEGDVKMPDVDVDVEGAGKIKGSKFSMPGFNISAPKIGKPNFDLEFKGPKVGGDVNVPDVNLEGDIKGPNIDIKGPKVDIETPDVKGSGFKLSMPSIHMPKFQAPDIDLNFKSPKLKGDYDVEMPSGKFEGEIKAPKVDVDMDVPEGDVEGIGGKFSLPKFKMPKFHMGGSKVEVPDVDIDANIPEADIKLSGPKIQGGVEMPDVDLDIEGGSKIKGPKIHMPKFNISAPKIGMPDFNLGVKGPKVEGDVGIPDVNLEGDIKGPNVDIKGPRVDIETPDVKGSGSKFSLPSMHLPKLHAPDIDLNFRGPKVKGDHEIDVPTGKIEGDIKGPKVDVDVPGIDAEGSTGKFSFPKFKFPKFRLGGPKVEGPDVDINAKIPTADIKLSGPKMEGNVEMPDMDVDVGGKVKSPKFKMPGFNINAPNIGMPGFKVEGPDADFGAKLPEADIKLAGPKVEGDVKIPDVDVEGSGKFKSPKFKVPGFNFSAPKIGIPDFDLEFKGPKMGGGVDLPDVNLEGDIKSPHVDIKGPNVEIEAPNLKGRGGKFSLPKISGPKVAGVEIPDVDLDVEGGSKIKGTKLKMPGFDISAPKIGMPDFNLELKSPKLGGDIDAPDLNMEGDIKGPNFNIKPPKVDLKMPDVKEGGPKISLPSVHLPHIKTPDFDLGFKGSKLKGGSDIDISSPNIGGEMKGPKIDVEAPDIDLEGTGGHFHMPKIKMPKFKIGGTKIDRPDVDIDASVPKANVKIDGADVPEINLDADSKIKGPGFQMPGFNISLPKFKGPNVDVSLKDPELKGGAEVPDINMGGDIKGPEFEMKGPKVDIVGSGINIEGPDLKGDGHKFSTPALDIGLKDHDLKGTADIRSPGFGIDVSAPKIDVGGEGGAHLKMPKMKKPKFGFGVKGQGDISAPSLDVDVPSPDVDVNVDSPDISVKTKGKKGKFKMPKLNIKSKKPKSELDLSKSDIDIKSPDLSASLGSFDEQLNIKSSKLKKPRFGKVKLSFPDIEFDLASPKVKGELPNAKAEGELQVPDVNLSSHDMKGPHIDIRAPGINVNTDADLQGPGVKVKGSKFPNVNIKSPKMADTNMDINLKGTNLKGEASGNIEGPTIGIKRPEINFDVDAPNVDIEKPEGKLKMKMKKPNVTVSGPNVNLDTSGGAEGKLKMPKMKLSSFGLGSKAGEIDTNVGVNLPKAEFSGPKLEGGIDMPSTDVNISAPKLNLESPDVRFGGLEGKLKMPELNISGGKDKGSGLNLGINAPKIGGDLKTPGLGLTVEAPDMDINTEGKIKGPQIDMSAPDVSVDLKDPQLKGSINLPDPNIKGIFKGPLMDVKGPGIDVDGGDFNIEGGKVKMPQINIPKVDTNIAGLKVKGDNFSGSGISTSDFGVNVKGPTLGTKLSGPKMDIKSPKVEIEGPSMKLNGADVNIDGLKEKFSSAAPKANIEFSGAKFEGGSLSADVPVKGGIGVSSSKSVFYDPELDVKAPGMSADIRTIELDVPLDKMKIPKFKPSQFKIKSPNLEEREIAVGARVPEIVSSAQGPGINIKGPQASVNLPEGEMESTGVKVKKGKIKMPKFNFSKSKGKSSSEGLEGDFSASGPKIDMKGSKGSLDFGDIEVEKSEISIAGKDPSLDITTSPKGKSRTLDFSLFKGKRSERHRSSSLSDENELSPSSPKGKLEFGEGAAGAKGKKSKLKFGTFGGFGAKSKGSYEVTLNEGEAEVEGSGIALVSKNSRIPSTSSSDSGSRAGLRFPKVELNINKKK